MDGADRLDQKVYGGGITMDVRETIANSIKFITFLLVTLVGFFTIYAMIWVSIGLPVNWWASLIIVAISALSEWGYVPWLAN